jgi:hypothetical protein
VKAGDFGGSTDGLITAGAPVLLAIDQPADRELVLSLDGRTAVRPWMEVTKPDGIRAVAVYAVAGETPIAQGRADGGPTSAVPASGAGWALARPRRWDEAEAAFRRSVAGERRDGVRAQTAGRQPLAPRTPRGGDPRAGRGAASRRPGPAGRVTTWPWRAARSAGADEARDRLTLAVIVNLYPPYVVGGNEVLARDVVEALRARGHTVHVLTGRGRELSRDPFTHPALGLDLDRKDDFFLGRGRSPRPKRSSATSSIAVAIAGSARPRDAATRPCGGVEPLRRVDGAAGGGAPLGRSAGCAAGGQVAPPWPLRWSRSSRGRRTRASAW